MEECAINYITIDKIVFIVLNDKANSTFTVIHYEPNINVYILNLIP